MSECDDPKSNGHRNGGWELPATFAYSDAIIGSGEIGICCVCADPFEWMEYSHRCAQLIAPSAPALCELAWRDDSLGEPRHDRLVGRHICFLAPSVPHSGIWKRKAEILVILVRPSLIERELGRNWGGCVVGEFAVLVAKDRMIWWLNSLCWRLCRKADSKDHPLIEEIGRSLARRLITAQFNTRRSGRKKATVLSPAQLQKITEYIETDRTRVRSVDDLAKVLGLSRQHFTRVFKNSTEVSPARYQKICRMQKAEEMLRSGNYRIEEIAFALGFKEASYFSRCFRDDFEMTPSDFMNEHRGQKS